MLAYKLYLVLRRFLFFSEHLNLHVLPIWIRLAYADQLFASVILYVHINPLKVAIPILSGCVPRFP